MKILNSIYGATGSVTVHQDSKATLAIRNQYGKLVCKSNHKNEKAAMAKWYRWEN